MSTLTDNCDKTRKFITEHLTDNIRSLALKANTYKDINISFALSQIAGWQKACIKLPSWANIQGIIYPKHISLEQCSSEATAIYKYHLVRRIIGNCDREKVTLSTSLLDLTGGFGVDFSFMARAFDKAVYVEQQEELCEIAQYNFDLFHYERTLIEIVNAEGINYLHITDPVTVIFIDPARRDYNGGKTVFISDCSPNIIPIEEELLLKAQYVVIKLSPMLDWHKAATDLCSAGDVVREVHILSVKNECKELLLVLQSEEKARLLGLSSSNMKIFCVNDDQVISFSIEEAKNAVLRLFTEQLQIGMYLYEPNSSLMKAASFGVITQKYPVSALAPNSHLFVSFDEIANFPGRSFVITGFSSFNKKSLKRFLSGLSKANIATRNFPQTVSELRKRLKLSEGGKDYLFATTLINGEHYMIKCAKI